MNYKYELASNKIQKEDCPYCKAKKHWQRYIDTTTGEVIDCNYGRCDNQNKCGKWIKPKKAKDECSTSYIPRIQNQTIICTTKQRPIDFDKKYFTKFWLFDTSSIEGYLTLRELETLLSNLPVQKNKNNEVSLLKGIYKEKTTGEFCTENTPFIFFDVDVKQDSNPHLLHDGILNETVFNVLKDLAVLVWRSNSQNGMAGIFHLPQIINLSHTERNEHLNISKHLFEYVSNVIEDTYYTRVDFDYAQGKYRQARYLAYQYIKREINTNYTTFEVVYKTGV